MHPWMVIFHFLLVAGMGERFVVDEKIKLMNFWPISGNLRSDEPKCD